jgi:hypothetical protein
MPERRTKTWFGPRYTQLPLPPYRYVPKESPHPLSDPAGHSYRPAEEPEPTVRPVAFDAWFESQHYLFGVDLYNHGYWWEAHESWEDLWRPTDRGGVQRRFLQGLIQSAVVHLKFRQRLAGGFHRLRESSRGHLESARRRISGSCYMGLDLDGFLASMEAYYAPLPIGDPHDPRRFPYIHLAFPPDGPTPAEEA